MNLDYLLPALALVLLGIGHAQAQDECRLDLSESRLDFGLMNRAIPLAPTPERLLGERRLGLTLNCSQPADMSLFYRGLAAGAERLRFTEQGSYRLQVREAVLDGRAVELGLIASSGQAPGALGSSLNWRAEHGIVPMQNGQPLKGRHFSVQVDVSAWAEEGAARVRDAVTWEASGWVDAPASGRARELQLLARFAPAACTPSLSNGGTVDFGKLSVKDLNADKDTALPDKQLALTVNCDGPTHFALVMQDNRLGSATGGTDETAYGLGLDARLQRIGRYYVNVDPTQASADNLAQVYRTDSTTAGAAWSNATAMPIPLAARSYLGFTASAGSTLGPTALQSLSARLSVQALIAPLQQLDLSSEIRLDGAATLEIIYL
jgi:type 1 fimbria pilin